MYLETFCDRASIEKNYIYHTNEGISEPNVKAIEYWELSVDIWAITNANWAEFNSNIEITRVYLTETYSEFLSVMPIYDTKEDNTYTLPLLVGISKQYNDRVMHDRPIHYW